MTDDDTTPTPGRPKAPTLEQDFFASAKAYAAKERLLNLLDPRVRHALSKEPDALHLLLRPDLGEETGLVNPNLVRALLDVVDEP